MSYSDDTISHDFYGDIGDIWGTPGQERTIQTEYCASLSRDELENEKRRLERNGWKHVRIRQRKDGAWTEYTWIGQRA